jgi:uncharacterized repeat protein (TIGR02543 family)
MELEADMRKRILAAALAAAGLIALVGCPVNTDDESTGSTTVTVSFDLGYEGAAGAPSDVIIEKDTPLGADFPPYPIRDGYQFDGWYDGTDFSTAVKYEQSSPPVTGNLTLTARWLGPCIVTFNLGGAAGTIEPVTVMV